MKRRGLLNLHIDIDYLSNRDLRLEDMQTDALSRRFDIKRAIVLLQARRAYCLTAHDDEAYLLRMLNSPGLSGPKRARNLRQLGCPACGGETPHFWLFTVNKCKIVQCQGCGLGRALIVGLQIGFLLHRVDLPGFVER
jgi:hypothetical protein